MTIPGEGQDVPYDKNNDEAKTDEDIAHHSLQSARELFFDVMTNLPLSASLDKCSEVTLRLLIEKLNVEKHPMKDLRTAHLWLHKIDLIRVLLTIIKEERTRN